jgi:hypothetical protein
MSNVKEENLLYCGYCGKVLTNKTEIEHGRWMSEYYCNPDCAMSRYFEYCESRPLEKEFYNEHGIKVLPDGRLYKKQGIQEKFFL